VLGAVAVQEPQRRVLVDDAEAEHLGEEFEAGVEVLDVEIDVGDAPRPVGLALRVGMVGAAGDEAEVAAVGVLAAEAVAAAARGGKLGRRADPDAARRNGAVERVDVRAAGDVENEQTMPSCGPRCSPTMW